MKRTNSSTNEPPPPPDPDGDEALARMRDHVARHYKTLLKIAPRFSLDRREAEELVHKTILQALRRAKSLRHEENVVAWLSKVMERVHLAELRRAPQRYEHVSINEKEAQLPLPQEEEPPPSAAISPEQLRAAIELLPPRLREPLKQYVLDGVPQAKIADTMGISHENVRVRIHRAKLMLSKLLRRTQ